MATVENVEMLEVGDQFRVPGWPDLIPRGEWATVLDFVDHGDGTVTVIHSFGESFLEDTDKVETREASKRHAGTDLRVPVYDPSYEDEILQIVRKVEGYETWWWDEDGPDYVFQMEDDSAANEAWEKLDDAGFESRIEG